jgi:hypothetical protein
MRLTAPRIESLDALIALLERDGMEVRPDREQNRVEVGNMLAGAPAPLLLQWDAERHVVQVVQALPWPVPVEKVATAESAIIRLNHALVVAGFGLNPNTRVAYYRLSALLEGDGSIAEPDLKRVVAVATRTAKEWGPKLASEWAAVRPGSPPS